MFDEIPNEYKTPEFCLEAVKENGVNIKHIPQDVLTEEMCVEAVKDWDGAVKYIPQEMRSEELLAKVARANWKTVAWMDDKEQTPEIVAERALGIRETSFDSYDGMRYWNSCVAPEVSATGWDLYKEQIEMEESGQEIENNEQGVNNGSQEFDYDEEER